MYVDDLQLSINNNFLCDKLYENEKLGLVLDYQKFNTNCHEINSLLTKNGYFLRIFELRKKFRYLSFKNPKRKTIVQQLSSCINEKYGFYIISIEYSKKLRKKFQLIDIIYKPIKSADEKILCYFSTDISKSYRNSCGDNEEISRGFAFESFCKNRSDKQKRHIENCSGVPGIIYNFNNKNMITFEENVKSKRNLPYALYFDFKTTAPTDNYFDPEQTKMFVVSYTLIVSFHPKLKIPKIIVERSYVHPLKELNSISYLTGDQLSFSDAKLISQLKDAAYEVNSRKCKNAIAQMFTIETVFVKKPLID